MTLLLVGPIAVAMLALLPTGLERLSRRINAPQAMATGFGLSLLGWAIVPPAWILCSIGSVVDLTAHRELTDFGCALGLGTAPWDLSGYLLTAAVIIPVSLSLFRRAKHSGARLDLSQMMMGAPTTFRASLSAATSSSRRIPCQALRTGGMNQ